MNSLLHVFLVVLLLHSVLNEITVEASAKNSLNLEPSYREQKNVKNVVKKSVKFVDLFVDVQYIIFDGLIFEDLLNVAKALPNSAPVTVDIFRKKYKNYQIDIHRANPNETQIQEIESIKRINLYHLKPIIDTLKLFGCAIQRLSIESNKIGCENTSKIINEHINTYGKALTHLELGIVKENTFANFIVPFNTVVNLSFTTWATTKQQLNTGALLLNELFPKIRSLSALLYIDVNYAFIDVKMPFLEHLQILATASAWHHKDQIEGMIRKNPQLKSVEIQTFPIDYTSTINTLLPNLEQFTIHDLQINEVVHFQHVKTFSYTYNLFPCESNAIANLRFSNLKTLQIKYSPDNFDAWINFFRQNRNLTKLHLIEFYTLEDVPFIAITNELKNLVDLTIDTSKNLNVENIIEFLENNDKLRRLQYLLRMPNQHFSILQQRFAHEWNIQRTNQGGISGLLLEKMN